MTRRNLFAMLFGTVVTKVLPEKQIPDNQIVGDGMIGHDYLPPARTIVFWCSEEAPTAFTEDDLLELPYKYIWVCDYCEDRLATQAPWIRGWIVDIEGEKLDLVCPECQVKFAKHFAIRDRNGDSKAPVRIYEYAKAAL